MEIDFSMGRWINQPKKFKLSKHRIEIVTEPETDFWQRSYYGFRNDNAPALLLTNDENFTFTHQVSFDYQQQFDQCGVIIYIDSENWFKASIEHEEERISRLGSVVTNSGYSDWATTDIQSATSIWYRLSRRGPDFLIESSLDGKIFKQMRIFHMHCLGETSLEMGKQNPPSACETGHQLWALCLQSLAIIIHSYIRKLPYGEMSVGRSWQLIANLIGHAYPSCEF